MNQREFLIDRQKGIGGSDVAAIMGVSPWKTPLDIYLEKITPIPEDVDFSKGEYRLKRGRKLEKYILEEYSERTFQELVAPEPGDLIIDPQYSFLRGNVDAYVKGNERILIEAKSSGGNSSQWENAIPLYYKTQVAFYAMISDCERVDVPVLFSGWNYECFKYHRDLEFEEEILQKCLTFWNEHVLKRNPPKPINLKDVQALYPISEETTCEVTQEVYKDVQTLARILKLKKRLIDREHAVKVRILDYMKENDKLMDGEKTLATWKTQSRSMIDMDRLREERYDIYKQYRKDQSVRLFRVKGDVIC